MALITEIKGGYYRTVKQLARENGCSEVHIRALLTGIRKQILKGRYSPYAVLDGGDIKINILVFYDYDKYRKMLDDPVQKKYVPKFNPNELAQICPVVERFVVVREGEADVLGL